MSDLIESPAVPRSDSAARSAVDVDGQAALDLLARRPLVVLTGAGLSTDSGIPDYRGPGAPVRQPMTFQEFVGSHEARQRYWARSHIGWSRMSEARPNAGHLALARLAPAVRLLVTQNVDGLHESAGSATLALHGRISDVVCLACGEVSQRARLQERMERLNPGFAATHAAATSRPDGDVELEATDGFVVPACSCGGVLKPHVVFFGENVPAARVERTYAAVESLVAGLGYRDDRADGDDRAQGDDGADGDGRAEWAEGADGADDRPGALLVVGSSLTVMSGLRFVKRAARLGVPIVIVNRGATRGDDLATVRVEAGCSEFLIALQETGLSETATSEGSVP